MTRTAIVTATLFGFLALTGYEPAIARGSLLSCMEPAVLDTNPNPAFSMLPGVYSSPSTSSKKIGIATSLVFAVMPLKSVDGFLQVLHPNGALGWVKQNELVSWHNVNTPSARCAAQVLPNGKPHAKYSS